MKYLHFRTKAVLFRQICAKICPLRKLFFSLVCTKETNCTFADGIPVPDIRPIGPLVDIGIFKFDLLLKKVHLGVTPARSVSTFDKNIN